MAGLEALTAMIYHERQQEGSMLCAQHALNSLLQGSYFTAPDLAAIAQTFDAMEHDTFERDESQRSGSHNMDDTGFFSVQVMDKALDVWGLHLVRWRGEQMRPYQDSPHKLLAFVLNLEQHWFTLRRFGPARTSIESDSGEGHWFNLNSQYPAPKWVSRTYLGMFLQQSEEEGYSVFAVVQADPSKPLALPRTEADLAGLTLNAPDAAPGHSFSSSSTSMPGSFPNTEGTEEVVIPDEDDYDINNEDVELQAALAASLTGEDQSFGQHAYVPRAPVPAPALRQAPAPPDGDDDDMDIVELPRTSTRTSSSAQTPSHGDAGLDPVAASMERNRLMLERMRRMQEEALRETYEEEAAGRLPHQQGAQTGGRSRAQDELERAIAASMADHDATTGTGTRIREDADDADDDEDWLPDDVDKENVPTSASARRRVRARPSSSNAVNLNPASGDENVTSSGVRMDAGEVHRVYDDEDEALQEALRASLQTMPEGFVHPPSPLPSRSAPAPATTVPPVIAAPANPSSSRPGVTSSFLKPEEPKHAEVTQGEEEEEERASSPPPPPAQVDVEEMRRRRLARFGAGPGTGTGDESGSGSGSN